MAHTKNTSLSRALTLNILLAFHIILLVALTFSITTTNPDARTKTDININSQVLKGNSKSSLSYITRAHNIRFDALGALGREVMDSANRILGMGIGMGMSGVEGGLNETGREMAGRSAFAGCA
ncbi:hypothetical protein ACEPPN_005546 [Leptodophora sp. 'Broadleaf-Isolate-01']